MSIEKVTKYFTNKTEKSMKGVYTALLGDECTEDQVDTLVSYVLSLGVEEEFKNTLELLFNEEDLVELAQFQEKYNERVEAFEVLLQPRLEKLMGDLDEDKLVELLGL